jgi:uncharacterized RDD family membrane protein YckC
MIAQTICVKNPYPGLRPFEAEDAEYFFGRDRQVDELLPRLRDHRFVAVLGVSGSGKSSLVRAGLIPALKAGHLTSSGSRWRIALMRPGSHPTAGLAAALDQALGARPDRLVNLRKSTNALLRDSRIGRQPDESLLVVVDQFEELFRVNDVREAAHFVDLLLAVEQDVSPEFRIYVVLTMRTDRLGECSGFDGLPEVLNRSLYLVPKLGNEQLRDAIEGPAASTNTTIEAGLVQQLVVEASEGSDPLPLLQHLLMILWEGRKCGPDGSPFISLVQYQAAGSAAQALNDHADQTLNELPRDRHRVASLIFRALIGGGGTSRDLRRPLPLSQLARETGASLDEVRGVVEHFYAANFLTSPDRTLTSDWEADITHESLIRQWKKLSRWVAEEATDADDYRFYSLNATRQASALTERSLDSAVRWVNKGYNASWSARYGGDFEATISYIRRSQSEAKFERRWRRYWAPAGAIVGVVGVLTQLDRIKAWDRSGPVFTLLFVLPLTAAVIVGLYILFERYGKAAVHRLTIAAITEGVSKPPKPAMTFELSSDQPGNQLPPAPAEYGGFGRRTISWAIDSLITLIVMIPLILVLAKTYGDTNENIVVVGTYAVLVPAHFFYQVLTMTSRRQATVGMRVARVYVADIHGNRLSWKRALARNAAKLLTFYSTIGAFMPLWTKRRQTLHDLVVGSVVLREPLRAVSSIRSQAVRTVVGQNP